jgi:FkbM family methyltransferase
VAIPQRAERWVKEVLKKTLPTAWLERLKRTATFQRRYYAQRLEAFREDEERDLWALPHLVADGDLVGDIGANFGIYTKFLSRHVGPGGRVRSVEPIPFTFGLLAYGVRYLQLSNVRAINCAVSDREGRVTMEIPVGASGQDDIYLPRIVEPDASVRRGVIVPAKTLDALFPDPERPSFLKVDVEGHELPCLRGARQLLARCRPIWLIEITSDPDDARSPGHALFALLGHHGYAAFWSDEKRLRRRRAGDVRVNYFFLTASHVDALRKRTTGVILE